jgi:hypothetical protein
MQEEGIPEEEYDFGVLCGGRRYKSQNTRAKKGESHSETEGRKPCIIV